MGILSWLFGNNQKEEIIKESKRSDAIDRANDSEIMLGNDYSTNMFYSVNKPQSRKSHENSLVLKYREYSQMADVEDAIDDIINEMVIPDSKTMPVKCDITKLMVEDKDVTEMYKDQIPKRFDRLLSLMDFNDEGYYYGRSFYVDGRQYVAAEFKKEKGVTDIDFLDFLKVSKKCDDSKGKKYHYEYKTGLKNEKGEPEVLIYKPSEIHYFTSGLKNQEGLVLSHLHKALKPINNLKMMENSLIVYRFVRAPERLIFRINVTGMNSKQATSYINQMMTNHGNKTVIDSVTGEIITDSSLMAMQENYWLAEKNGNSHQIESLPGGQNLSAIDEVIYFLKKMYKSLNVPSSRLESDASFQFGRSDEISRDEQKFFKFIKRIRKRFEKIFLKLLEVDLINAEIMPKDDWDQIKTGIRFIWENDSTWEESAQLMKYSSRAEAARDFIELQEQGFYSKYWIKKNILRQTDAEIEEIQEQIEKEKEEEPIEDEE